MRFAERRVFFYLHADRTSAIVASPMRTLATAALIVEISLVITAITLVTLHLCGVRIT